MEQMFGVVVFGVALLVTLWLSFRSVKGSRESIDWSLAVLDEVIEGVNKSHALDEERFAQQARLIEQGDETIALLKAIKDNLEHRSIKN